MEQSDLIATSLHGNLASSIYAICFARAFWNCHHNFRYNFTYIKCMCIISGDLI